MKDDVNSITTRTLHTLYGDIRRLSQKDFISDRAEKRFQERFSDTQPVYHRVPRSQDVTVQSQEEAYTLAAWRDGVLMFPDGTWEEPEADRYLTGRATDQTYYYAGIRNDMLHTTVTDDPVPRTMDAFHFALIPRNGYTMVVDLGGDGLTIQ